MLCLALCDLLYVLLRSTNMSEAILFFIIIIIFLSLFIQGSTTFHVLKTFPPSFTFTFFWKIVIFHLNLEINIPLNPFFSIFLFGLPSIFENMNKTSLYNNLVSVINQFDDHWKNLGHFLIDRPTYLVRRINYTWDEMMQLYNFVVQICCFLGLFHLNERMKMFQLEITFFHGWTLDIPSDLLFC